MVSSGVKSAIAVIGYDPPLVRECVGRGMRTVMVRDVRGHLRGRPIPLPAEVEEVVVSDITDIGEVLAALTRLFGDRLREDLRAVVSFEEFAFCTVAALTSLLKLPGTPPDCSIVMRDKHLQKQAVRAAGLPAAASRVVVPGSDSVRTPFPGPCVVKPIAGAATMNTTVVRTEVEYQSLMERLAAVATTPFVVEDLVDVEQEWIVDGVIQGGSLVFSSVARYAEPCLSYTTGNEAFIHYRADGTGEDERCEQARAFAGKALQALDYTDGVFHMELLLDRSSDAFVFGECGGRLGGGLTQEAVLLKHDFSLAAAAVDVALGQTVEDTSELLDRCVGVTTLHLPRGTIVKLPDAERFSAPDDIHELRVTALLGVNDPPEIRSTVGFPGYCVVSADSLEELGARMAAVRRDFAEQSLVAPTFATVAEQRAFMATYEDKWRQLL